MKEQNKTTVEQAVQLILKGMETWREQTLEFARLVARLLDEHPTLIEEISTKCKVSEAWFRRLVDVGNGTLIPELFPYVGCNAVRALLKLDLNPDAQRKYLNEPFEFLTPTNETLNVSLLEMGSDEAKQIFDTAGKKIRSLSEQRLWREKQKAVQMPSVKVDEPIIWNARWAKFTRPCELTLKGVFDLYTKMVNAK